ncbi:MULTISPECIES: ATP synthase subunit I [unclassified Microcystis]|nr:MULTISPECIES: ATP synthase subunit I [unclassified Microcystis]MCA2928685.1 ATP synthase subunit I [Microcystis sp. M020S1]MCA2937150.1 ATP synthase subunit I [Microcystis sp. M015S1]MCA2621259.1 ATP synthase subunit I [Microcystis sp. M099S2]MCA2650139.1 ATP synthase subunit I [Microcystis sp. M065S2]MCA2681159.1 ATP synthase subunit I [Microcystis sp. M043S2]
MIELLYFPLALLAGMALGLAHFGGLWLTVRQLPRTHNPMVLTLISFLGRTSIILLGFYAIIVAVPDLPVLYLLLSLATFFWTRNLILQQVQPKFRSN